jgi:hypothetical protein
MKDNQTFGTDEASCSYCRQKPPGGHWFARLWRGGRCLAFCCPRCVEKFLEESGLNAESAATRYDAPVGPLV